MEGIQHRTVDVNGIKMHIAEKGESPVVLFIHGFPELWSSWRHQILALSSLVYFAVALDLRGYGDTEVPSSMSSYTCFHVVGDLVALLDTLEAEQAYVVAHDLGAIIGWYLCMFRPDRVQAYVCLSVPLLRRHPKIRIVDAMRATSGDDYYIWLQEPGKMKAEMAKIRTKYALKNILTTRKPGQFKDNELGVCICRNWELAAPRSGVQITVPVKFITGDLDLRRREGVCPWWRAQRRCAKFRSGCAERCRSLSLMMKLPRKSIITYNFISKF